MAYMYLLYLVLPEVGGEFRKISKGMKIKAKPNVKKTTNSNPGSLLNAKHKKTSIILSRHIITKWYRVCDRMKILKTTKRTINRKRKK